MVTNKEQPTSLGALDQYVAQVGRIPPLTEEEEEQLLRHIGHKRVGCAGGCSSDCVRNERLARDRMVEGYQPFVLSLAKKYAPRDLQADLLLDFVQEGNVGLLQAIEGYDEVSGKSSFRTWAFLWIGGRVRAAFWQQTGMIRIPVRKARAIRRMEVVATKLLSELDREPMLEEMAREMGIAEQEVRELVVLRTQQEVVSLHVSTDEDGELLLDMIPDASSSPESVEEVFGCLRGNERLVMQLRYGVGVHRPHSHKEIAASLGLALSAVQALEESAKRGVRRALGKHLV